MMHFHSLLLLLLLLPSIATAVGNYKQPTRNTEPSIHTFRYYDANNERHDPTDTDAQLYSYTTARFKQDYKNDLVDVAPVPAFETEDMRLLRRPFRASGKDAVARFKAHAPEDVLTAYRNAARESPAGGCWPSCTSKKESAAMKDIRFRFADEQGPTFSDLKLFASYASRERRALYLDHFLTQRFRRFADIFVSFMNAHVIEPLQRIEDWNEDAETTRNNLDRRDIVGAAGDQRLKLMSELYEPVLVTGEGASNRRGGDVGEEKEWFTRVADMFKDRETKSGIFTGPESKSDVINALNTYRNDVVKYFRSTVAEVFSPRITRPLRLYHTMNLYELAIAVSVKLRRAIDLVPVVDDNDENVEENVDLAHELRDVMKNLRFACKNPTVEHVLGKEGYEIVKFENALLSVKSK